MGKTMCDCDDIPPNEFYRAREQTAKKQHRCCECYKPINIGDKYTYIAGKSDDFWTAKQCLSCSDLTHKMWAEFPSMCFCFGELIDTIRETELLSFDEESKKWSSNVDWIVMDGNIPRIKQT
jgi:hypothetical protein